MDRDIEAFVFIMGYAALGVANYLLFQASRNYWLKQRLYPWVWGSISLGVPLVVGLVGNCGFKQTALFVLGGCVVYLIHVRQIRFCRECGATNNNPMWPFQSLRFCRECGSPFGRRHE